MRDDAGVTTFTTPSEREMTATRVVDAPRSLVWDASTSPDHVPHWMLGPSGWTMPTCEIDLRPGGAWHFGWVGPDGATMEMRGRYREVAPPERLVHTESWGGDWPETRNTLVLTEEGGRTRITCTVTYPSREARDAALGTGMKDGWSASYDRLDAYLRASAKEASLINCYAFASVPPFARGLVRDLRVRWALEEAGLPYRVTLVGEGDGTVTPSAYRALQPFGQVPAIEDGDLRLFESGAIVLYVAERSPALLPDDPPARAQVIQWMFAALNTIEPPIQQLTAIDLFYAGERWASERRPAVVEAARRRLGELAARLDGRDHLVGRFSAADVLMTSVLRIVRHTDLVEEHPVLAAYKERCEARPAFVKALADQMATFEASTTRSG